MTVRIKAKCPNCYSTLKVPEELLGKTARCPACEQQVAITTVEPVSDLSNPDIARTESGDGTETDISDASAAETAAAAANVARSSRRVWHRRLVAVLSPKILLELFLLPGLLWGGLAAVRMYNAPSEHQQLRMQTYEWLREHDATVERLLIALAEQVESPQEVDWFRSDMANARVHGLSDIIRLEKWNILSASAKDPSAAEAVALFHALADAYLQLRQAVDPVLANANVGTISFFKSQLAAAIERAEQHVGNQ